MIFSAEHKLRKELEKLGVHARHTLLVDDDILSDGQKKALRQIDQTAAGCNPDSAGELSRAVEDCRRSYKKFLPPPKYAWIREYLDVLAVAAAVAFGIRGLFLQPFKIPTSSMQPTLFGIHYIAQKGQVNPLLGQVSAPLDYLLFSCERARLRIEQDGILEGGNPYEAFRQSLRYGVFPYTWFTIGGVNYGLPGEWDKVSEYSGLYRNFSCIGETVCPIPYKAGEVLCNGWLSSGDHLFVDRFSHLLAGLRRGDVVVFNTENIYYNGRALAKNGYYYIKRLAGLPGDTLKIVHRTLYIRPRGETRFKPVTDFSPKFRKLYSNQGGYHGHLNLPHEHDLSGDGFTVPDDSYFMLGDNSRTSLDSRYWGTVPRRNIVGKALFVFWPFSRRWGLTDRLPPLPVTTDPDSLVSMHLQ
ncbi:MAG: signal peptidase I [Victivallaceae bacterium]|nr:signal peptidase I [Victivallaceae bacterium]